MKSVQRKKPAGRMLSAAVVLLAAATLSGCGEKVTAEGLMQEAAEKMAEVKSMKGVYDMDMTMGVSQSGISMDVDVSANMDFESTAEPSAMHCNMVMDMGMLGLSVETEMYVMMEEDQAVSYVCMGDQWMKQSAAMPDTASDTGMVLNLDTLFGENAALTLLDETEEENGKEVYVITGTVSAEDIDMEQFNEIMGSTGAAGLDDLGLDLSGLQMDVALRLYTDSRLPASVSMKSSGDGEVFTMEMEGVETTLDSLSYELKIEEYDTVDEIVLPEEASGAIDLNSEEFQVAPAYGAEEIY